MAGVIANNLALFGVGSLLALALFVAIVDVSLHYVSRITLRLFTDGKDTWKAELIERYLEDPMSLLLPLRVGFQSAMVGVTVLLTELFVAAGVEHALALAFVSMLLILLVFREVLPNVIALKSPERVLQVVLPAVRVYVRMMTPLTRPLARFIRLFLRKETDEPLVSKDEGIQAFIETGQEEGLLEADEGRMVQSIVDLSERWVKEIMTPRPNVVAVSRDVTLGELREVFAREKYSRMPVYEEDLDHVVGLVYAIDLLSLGSFDLGSPIESLIHPVPFVPETKRVSDLLRELQKNRSTLTMVVDEYGGTSGLVTVEDIMEEIVGEIHDEFDESGKDIVRESEGVFLVSGTADIDHVKEELKLDVDVEDRGFETVSGFLFDILGRVPNPGEIIDYQKLNIEVVDAEGHRINKVRFRLPQERRV